MNIVPVWQKYEPQQTKCYTIKYDSSIDKALLTLKCRHISPSPYALRMYEFQTKIRVSLQTFILPVFHALRMYEFQTKIRVSLQTFILPVFHLVIHLIDTWTATSAWAKYHPSLAFHSYIL